MSFHYSTEPKHTHTTTVKKNDVQRQEEQRAQQQTIRPLQRPRRNVKVHTQYAFSTSTQPFIALLTTAFCERCCTAKNALHTKNVQTPRAADRNVNTSAPSSPYRWSGSCCCWTELQVLRNRGPENLPPSRMNLSSAYFMPSPHPRALYVGVTQAG